MFMKATLLVMELSLVGVYGAFGFLKTFRTQKVKEQMPWAGNRSEHFIRFIGVSELTGALGVLGLCSQTIFNGWLFWRQAGLH